MCDTTKKIYNLGPWEGGVVVGGGGVGDLGLEHEELSSEPGIDSNDVSQGGDCHTAKETERKGQPNTPTHKKAQAQAQAQAHARAPPHTHTHHRTRTTAHAHARHIGVHSTLRSGAAKRPWACRELGKLVVDRGYGLTDVAVERIAEQLNTRLWHLELRGPLPKITGNPRHTHAHTTHTLARTHTTHDTHDQRKRRS